MIPEAQDAASLTDAALQLAVRCLSYDFIGHASMAHSAQGGEESETVTLAVPLSWKGELSNPALTDMLFGIVSKFGAPQAPRALELLLLLSSVPRSLYETQQSFVDISSRVFAGAPPDSSPRAPRRTTRGARRRPSESPADARARFVRATPIRAKHQSRR